MNNTNNGSNGNFYSIPDGHGIITDPSYYDYIPGDESYTLYLNTYNGYTHTSTSYGATVRDTQFPVSVLTAQGYAYFTVDVSIAGGAVFPAITSVHVTTYSSSSGSGLDGSGGQSFCYTTITVNRSNGSGTTTVIYHRCGLNLLPDTNKQQSTKMPGDCPDLEGDIGIDTTSLTMSILNSIGVSARSSEGLWLNTQASLDDLLGLDNFLSDNTSSINGVDTVSQEAADFANLAIEALMNGEISSFEEVTYVVEAAEDPIENMSDYLDCFDNSQSASITIYVNEPTDGYNYILGEDLAGHTFVSLKQGDNIASYGFYPESALSSIFRGTQGTMEDNSNTEFDVSLTINNISPSRLQAIINLSISYSISDYHLSQRNCTDIGVELANLAGLPIPECNANPVYFFGSTPGKLGEYMRNLTLPTGVTRNITGGNSPDNNCN